MCNYLLSAFVWSLVGFDLGYLTCCYLNTRKRDTR